VECAATTGSVAPDPAPEIVTIWVGTDTACGLDEVGRLTCWGEWESLGSLP
jgi:hypothetical protein